MVCSRIGIPNFLSKGLNDYSCSKIDMWPVEIMLSHVDGAGKGGGNLNINLNYQTNTTDEVSTRASLFYVTALNLGTWVDTQLNFLISSQ